MTGEAVGPYEVGEKLGEGGMGVVYRAHDKRLLRSVALKFLSGKGQSPASRRRFLREAQIASALNHPGIVTIHDIGEHGGETYIVMEYVEGKPLRELISRKGMEAASAVSRAMQMADALAAAHAAGIVHRDLKPGNVIVTEDGRVKILDFGLAGFTSSPETETEETRTQLTAANAFVGTAAYVSPEQSLGRPMDHRSDVFALAIVIHEMLTGRRPFEGHSTLELIFDINMGVPQRLRESRPDLPWSLEALLLRMLEKNPEDRVQSMVMVRASLAAIEKEILQRQAQAAIAGGLPTEEPPVAMPARAGSALIETTGDSGGEIAVAVLRFRATPPGPEAEEFSDGLTSETVQALGGIPRIRVASRLAASHFEDGKSSIQVASRALGVRYVLTGTVRRSGERVRVLCELADTATGSQLWSKTYTRDAGDPFDAQEQIARAIAAAVSGAVLTISARQAADGPSEKLDAPALVRRSHLAVVSAYNRDAIEEAVRLVRQAVATSNYGPAHAYLGMYLQQRVINGFSDDPDRDRHEALTQVERALQLEPGDPEVLQNAGIVFLNQSQPERAIGVLRRAVEIAEFNLVAWGYLALVLGWTGGEKEMDEAQSIYARLLRDTPDHPSMPYWLYFKAGVCFRQGKYHEALECTRECVERQPHFLVGLLSHANALGMVGRYEEARKVVQQVVTLSPGAGEQQYIRELTNTVCTRDRVDPHIAGLIAAGIFKGE